MLIRQECKRRLINRQSLQIPTLSNKAFELTASFFVIFDTVSIEEISRKNLEAQVIDVPLVDL